MARRRTRQRSAFRRQPAVWLEEVGGLSGDFDLTPAIEAAIDRLARAGRRDPAARNALYAALEVKIERFLAPYQGKETPVGEFADLRQEAFPIFAGLVRDWAGEGTFARYFLAFFPWRLRHVIEAHERRWPRRRILLLSEDWTLPEGSLDDLLPECHPALLVGPLGAEDRALLYLRFVEGLALEEIAPLLGWSRRTAFRRWRALAARLEAQFAGELDLLGRLLASWRRAS